MAADMVSVTSILHCVGQRKAEAGTPWTLHECFHPATPQARCLPPACLHNMQILNLQMLVKLPDARE